MSHSIEKLTERRSLAVQLAAKYGMDTDVFLKTIAKTIMPAGAQVATPEQTAAFLVVANQYGLNPFNREIYAFPAKNGGVQAIVSVDGWFKLANEHPAFDGLDFEDGLDDKGNVFSVTCRVYRKDRSHPISVTEYMSECKRNTEPWQRWGGRMLRHKAAIQALRIAFGFAGIIDPDEAERYASVGAVTTEAKRVDLDALPEASLDAPPAPNASLGDKPKSRRGRPRKAESVPLPEPSAPQSVTLENTPAVNEDAEDPALTPLYQANVIPPSE